MRTGDLVSAIQKRRPIQCQLAHCKCALAYEVSASEGTSHRKYPAILLGVKKKGTGSSYHEDWRLDHWPRDMLGQTSEATVSIPLIRVDVLYRDGSSSTCARIRFTKFTS
jgi:hypothetical protein